ncbi:MAG: aminoacetone oxidase family FAD-binding enzyme [Candidatus Brocadiaceae bacterium]|nr:aminoacetone oxidase family FAD-binding enzyme [Candidatus Brocadiaceae bacterium]
MTPAQQVVVVGAGPAGMMAAARAAERGARVQLLERGPEPGRKLLMTGNGRCNLSNAAPAAQFLHAYGPAGRFLRTALATLDLRALTAWLAAHGIRTVQEDHGRVFPADRRARSVRDALVGALHAAGAELLHGQRVEGLLIEDGRLLGVRTADRVHAAGCVIVATGGLSYPATGSTGDGYELARQAGHAVHAPYAAVTALRTVETWPGRLQGTAARGAAVRTRIDGDATPGRHAGDLMWTHYGVSGPAVLAVSLAVTRALQEGRSVVLEIDLVASTPQDALQADLKRMADSGSRHTVLRVLRERLPERTARVLADVLALDPALPVARCTRAERVRIVQTLKCLPLRVAGPRPIAEAIVTGGGVAPDEVDPRTMESLRVPGLFFAGELLDAHGPTGGHNLHAALATGYLAGEHAASRIHTAGGPC